MRNQKLMSQREYAKRRGVSHQAVSKAVRDERIPTVDGKIDPVEADKAWEANTNPVVSPKAKAKSETPATLSPSPETQVEIGNGSFAEARRKHEWLRVGEKALHLSRLRKKLVDAETVEVAAFNQARAERDALLNWVDRNSALIAGELGVEERNVHVVLSKYIREFLSEQVEAPLLHEEPQGQAIG